MTTMTNQRIVYSNPDGTVAVIVPAESVDLALKDVPEGVPYEIITTADIPSDRTFRGAWVAAGAAVDVDIDLAKGIAHDKRRAKRSEEFQPFDEVIAKQIPGVSATDAEASRQVIRDKYAAIQVAIEAAATVDELLEVTP